MDDAPKPDHAQRNPAPRSRPPGLKDLAAHLNLSAATVSMVINDVPLAKSLSEETRARVLAAAKEFNYRPNLLARALSKRESRTVGVIAPESSDGYFPRVMQGIETTLLDAGYLYFTASHLGREELLREYPTALIQRGVDGLIFVNTRMYTHPGVPAVSISDDCAIEGVTSILADQQQGMSLGMGHLAGMGHRRMVMMRGSPWSVDAGERFRCVAAAAAQWGVPVLPELSRELGTGEWSPENAYQAMMRQLQRSRDFTAVFAFNDVAAMGAIRALQDHGIRCPEEVSVLGVDDNSTAAYTVPRLSTLAQPLEEMGAAAARCVLDKIRSPAAVSPRCQLFPMTLHPRESTRALRVSEERCAVAPSASAEPVAFGAGV